MSGPVSTLPQRPLGNTGLFVSALGFGAASIGFAPSGREDTFVPLIQQAVELGITLFDTAPDYRHSEAYLGRALVGRRDKVVLATKVGRLQTWDGNAWQVQEDWTEEGVLRTVEQSLRNLQTDYLDVAQLHSPPLWVLDDGSALRGLERAKQAGKLRHIGISADGAEAQRALAMGVFATLQTSYSLLQQAPGDAILPAAQQQGMGLIAKQPIANGIPLLTTRPEHPDWSWKWDVAQQLPWTTWGADDDRLAFALRWVLSNPLATSAIVGMSRLEHLLANVAAATTQPLDQAILDQTKAAYNRALRDVTG